MVDFFIFNYVTKDWNSTMFDDNKKRSFCQELQTIGLKFTNEVISGNNLTLVFDHRGIQVLIDAIVEDCEITKLSNFTINGNKINAEFDCASIGKTEFDSNLDLYISLINKEIMKLDGING